MIREANHGDVSELTGILREFCVAWHGLAEFHEPSVRKVLCGLVESPDGFLWRGRRSVMAGSKEPVWFNHNQFEARELVWFAKDGQGGRLLQQFEKWAGDMPVVIGMSPLIDIARGLGRRGYERHDRTFRKVS